LAVALRARTAHRRGQAATDGGVLAQRFEWQFPTPFADLRTRSGEFGSGPQTADTVVDIEIDDAGHALRRQECVSTGRYVSDPEAVSSTAHQHRQPAAGDGGQRAGQ